MTAAPDWPEEDLDDLTHAQLRKRRDDANRVLCTKRTTSKEYAAAIERLEFIHRALLRKPS